MQEPISESIASSEALAFSLRQLINTIRREHPAPTPVPGLTTARFCALLTPDCITPTHEESNLLDRLEHLIDRRVESAIADKTLTEQQIADLLKTEVKELEDTHWFERMLNRMIDNRTESIGEELTNDARFIRSLVKELDPKFDEEIRDGIKAEYQSGDFDTKVEEVILEGFTKLLDQLDEESLDALAVVVLKRIELRPRNSSAPTTTTLLSTDTTP